jgi:hypothetical protein
MHARFKSVPKWVALVSIVALTALLASPAGANVTSSFRHLWREHIKPKLAREGTFNAPSNPVDWTRLKNVPLGEAGTINTPTNPVDWSQLKNVPAGFADGTDNEAANSGGGQAPPAPPGAPTGVVGLEVVKQITPEDTKNGKGVAVFCPAGKKPLGGGAVIRGPGGGNASLMTTAPTPQFDGWTAYGHEHVETAASWSIEVSAICAPPA